AFHVFNAGRCLLDGRFSNAAGKLAHALRFAFGTADYRQFEYVARTEQARGLRGHFSFYGGEGGWRRSPARILLDPRYDIAQPDIAAIARALADGGFTIGLHQSFHAWNDAALMQMQRARIEQSIGKPVRSCRQHWLRFSWRETWKAQQQAGMLLDTTLGFN